MTPSNNSGQFNKTLKDERELKIYLETQISLSLCPFTNPFDHRPSHNSLFYPLITMITETETPEFVWVKYNGRWEVAMIDLGKYWLPASDKPYEPHFFEQIGEPVTIPD